MICCLKNWLKTRVVPKSWLLQAASWKNAVARIRTYPEYREYSKITSEYIRENLFLRESSRITRNCSAIRLRTAL